jgi:hypothetical protein
MMYRNGIVTKSAKLNRVLTVATQIATKAAAGPIRMRLLAMRITAG